MERRVLTAYLFLACVILPMLQDPTRNRLGGSIDGSGSLIVLVENRSGIALCTDRRSYNIIDGASDRTVKLRVVSQHSVFAVIGITSVLDRWLTKKYDLFDDVTRLLAAAACVRVEECRPALEYGLRASYLAYHPQYSRSAQEAALGSTDLAFSVYFVETAPKQKVTVTVLSLFDYRLHGQGVEMRSENLTESLKHSPIIDGQTEVSNAILGGKDSRFAAFWKDPSLQSVWFHRKTLKTTTAEDFEFARKLVRWTNAYHSVVARTPTLVSAEADCGFLPNGGEFSLQLAKGAKP